MIRQALPTSRPFLWERSYPPGVAWDAPIETTTLPGLIDTAVARWRGRPALDDRGERMSYDELGRAIDRLARGLLATIGPGRTLALYLPNCRHHPQMLFAAAKAGCRIVQLSPLDAERELQAKLADSGASVLVTIDLEPLVSRARGLLVGGHVERMLVAPAAGSPISGSPAPGETSMAALAEAGSGGSLSWPAIAPDDIALLQYTGGTTGLPKAAMLSHANLTAAVEMGHAWARPQGLSRPGEGRIICVLPLFHIYALTSILLRGLSNGSEIVLQSRFDATAILDEIEQGRATALPGVPTMWIALLAVPGIERRDLSPLVTIASGGAPLPVEVQDRVEQVFARPLLGGWGMTETCPAGTQIPPARPDKRGTIGLPLPGIEMTVVALDDPGRRLAPGQTGEIAIRGANVTRGYWRRPEETAAAFHDGWLLTGDVGCMDADGFFFLVDRKKDMIISGGFNVYPRVIEEAIYEHPSIAEAMVIGVPDDYRGEAAKAFVTLRAGHLAPSLAELRDFLASRLGRHELPAALEVREALPRTGVGKLAKKLLVDEERAKRSAS